MRFTIVQSTFILLLICFFSSCSKPPLGEIVLFEDDLSSIEDWEIIRSEGSGYETGDEDLLFAFGYFIAGLWQGEDCARLEVRRPIQGGTLELQPRNSDLLTVVVYDLATDYSGLGGASIEIVLPNMILDLDLPIVEAADVRFEILDGEVIGVYSDDQEPSHWQAQVRENLESDPSSCTISLNACGPDLYAAANVSFDRIELSMTP